jgi:protein-tyrosine phosphatase
MTTDPTHAPLPPGRIDIHCHLLPGVDDGCATLDDTIACITRFKELGFAGSVLTPHIVPTQYPNNTPANIRLWVDHLREDLAHAGIDYQIWPGAELRASENIISWMADHGVPTLADSRCVLIDFWADKWPAYATELFEWLLNNNYQPILAHPERIKCCLDPRRINDLIKMGVWLQGNCKAVTGTDGFHAQQFILQTLRAGLYTFLATDCHKPNSLEARLDGMQLIAVEHGDEMVDQLMADNPRQLLGL